MTQYLKNHEIYILGMLDMKMSDEGLDEVISYHKTQIEFLQHERLIHLLVTLSIALFLLLFLFFTLYSKIPEVGLIDILLFALLVPYIFHYYTLENGVQRWYKYYNRLIEEKNSR